MKNTNSPDGSEKIRNFNSINWIIRYLVFFLLIPVNAYFATEYGSTVSTWIVYFFNTIYGISVVFSIFMVQIIRQVWNQDIEIVFSPTEFFYTRYFVTNSMLIASIAFFYHHQWYGSMVCYFLALVFGELIKNLTLLLYSGHFGDGK